MPHLYLLRHGKSDWGADYAGDHERPLAARGIEAAGHVGRFLTVTGEVPERVVSSTAVRARTTAELAAKAGGWDREVELEAGLYGASPGDVLTLLKERAGDAESVLLVGHQPTWSGVVAALTGAVVRFPTAACARIDLATASWSGVRERGGELRWLVPPRMLAKIGTGG